MKSCCENKSSELLALRKEQGKILKIVLVVNFVMFLIEFSAGLSARSSALKADSLDMLGDALVYGFSLYVLHREAHWKAGAAFLKGLIIMAFGIGVFIEVIFKVFADVVPAPEAMGAIGLLALAANVACLLLLLKHRNDDLNMRSTFICSRNDIISNTGVIVAAIAVRLLGSKWPDIVIGLIISVLFLKSAVPILRESMKEYRILKQTV